MVANKVNKTMLKHKILIWAFAFFSAFLCAFYLPQAKKIAIETDMGTIKIELFDDTPRHRDNFLKNMQAGKYEGSLFHRVIREFMIQGGDPESKKAKPGALTGFDAKENTVEAEMLPHHFHCRGALSAARQPDEVNPKRRSSPYQFFIVEGRVYTEGMLRQIENRKNRSQRLKVMDSLLIVKEEPGLRHRIDSLMKARDTRSVDKILDAYISEIDAVIGEKKLFRYSPEQIKAYTTIGGRPELDGEYTVFGMVTEGLDIIQKIGAAEVDKNNRPLKDIPMKIKPVE